MTRDQIIKVIVEGSEIYFRSFALSGIIHRNEFGIEWVAPNHGGNDPSVVFRVNFTNETELDHALAKIVEGEIPALWVLFPLSTPSNILDTLVARGFTNLSSKEHPEYGMALELVSNWKVSEADSQIEVKKVFNGSSFKAWIEVVNTALHGTDLLTSENYAPWLDDPAYTFYLGYMNGIPISTAAILQNGGNRTASLEFVSTLAEYRRRGAAYAVCMKALHDQQTKGIQLVTLRSSHEAAELYRKLNFQPYYEQLILLHQSK